MASTTVHLPEDLLEALDAHAKAQGISRNRFIRRALEQALRERDAWSPGFLEELRRPLSASDARAVDELVEEVRTRRSSKAPPEL